jgi:predicted GNAT family acetyltransferase
VIDDMGCMMNPPAVQWQEMASPHAQHAHTTIVLMQPMPGLTVEHHPELSRFQASVEGRLCVADYRLSNGVMHMTHTAVPPALQGRGIAAAIVQAALAHARAQSLRVDPLCSYVARYMQRHPETQDLHA